MHVLSFVSPDGALGARLIRRRPCDVYPPHGAADVLPPIVMLPTLDEMTVDAAIASLREGAARCCECSWCPEPDCRICGSDIGMVLRGRDIDNSVAWVERVCPSCVPHSHIGLMGGHEPDCEWGVL